MKENINVSGEMEKFGLEVKRLRIKKGLPQKFIAARLEYTRGFISKIETGRKVFPVIDDVLDFGAICGVGFFELKSLLIMYLKCFSGKKISFRVGRDLYLNKSLLLKMISIGESVNEYN